MYTKHNCCPAIRQPCFTPFIMGRLHYVMTKYEEIKLLVSEGFWFHGDLKTLSDFANIKSKVSLAMCNTEWMLLYEESCMQQPGVKRPWMHFYCLVALCFLYKQFCGFHFKSGDFKTKTRQSIVSTMEKLCSHKSPTFISVSQKKSK